MKRLVYAALFVAFGLVLPTLFHAVGMGGSVFLPMHIPVLLAGLALGPTFGAAVGLMTPLLSFLLTGMPPVSPPILPTMMVELAVYGLVAGLLVGKAGRSVWVPLVAAIVAGRVALGLAVAGAVLLVGFKASPVAYALGSVVTGLPGIAIQLVVVPSLYKLLGLLPADLGVLQVHGGQRA